MSKHESFYRQCELVRPVENGYEVMVSWIPEEIASISAIVRLKDGKGEWTKGWSVRAIYGRMPFSYLKKRDRDHINQRKQSDV